MKENKKPAGILFLPAENSKNRIFLVHYPEGYEDGCDLSLEAYAACCHNPETGSVFVSGFERNEDGFCYFTFNDMVKTIPEDAKGFWKYMMEENQNNGFSEGWFASADEMLHEITYDDLLVRLVDEIAEGAI